MHPTQKTTLWLSALVLAAGLLPLRSDGDAAQCRNVTTSLSAQVNNPVAGDEAFFKLPSGPSNVMLLLDNSGSMQDLPQCATGDFSSTSSTATCSAPPLGTPSVSGSAGAYSIIGTCYPATDPALASSKRNTGLAWMESITPTDDLPDPGHQPAVAATGVMTDDPPWAKNCSTGTVTDNHCLFDKNAYYKYNSWTASATSDSATRAASDTDPALTKGCIYRISSSLSVDLGSACTSCMSSRGFYFFNIAYIDGSGSKQSTGVQHRFKGTFLNANPPKYVTARYVLKDVAWIDPGVPKLSDSLRLGLSILRSDGTSGTKAGGTLVVPLGPDKLHSWPYAYASAKPVRQAIIDAINTKKSDGTAAPGAFKPYDSYTPIGSALFNIGQYFADPTFYQDGTITQSCRVSCTTSNKPASCGSNPCTKSNNKWTCQGTCPVYTSSHFTGTGPYDLGWSDSAWKEAAKGTVNASWAVQDLQCTECWSCQKNSVIVVTDGMPNYEITFPTEITSDPAINADYLTYCGNGACSNAQVTNPVAPKVAAWLNKTELRPGTAQGARHALNFHTVGFSVSDQAAKNTLTAIALMGKGTVNFAESQSELISAVWSAVNTTTPKETSFSAASANSLQTIQTAASDAYLTRFLPSDVDPAWEGHLFQGALFDEFLNGCDTTKTPAAQKDIICPSASPSKTIKASFGRRVDTTPGSPNEGNALCDGVYLIDNDCDIVEEDSSTGFFVKANGTDAGKPAEFPWDAGEVLSTSTKTGYVGASDRKIFTWVGGQRRMITTDAADVAALKPYLNIDPTWCTQLLSTVGVTSTDPTTACAVQVINFLRGWDVMDFDRDGCGGPGRSTNAASCTGGVDGEERNRANDSRTVPRFWKLGDIFHSSPAVVTAPIDAIRCDTGYEKQCVATIRSPAALPLQTSNPAGAYAGLGSARVDAYEKYRLDNRQRRRVVLVGANDGMLHAFDAGLPSTCDAQGVCGYSAGSGTGEELWAFVPPDLLPRLRDMLTEHQYMVDGSVMVRDVWVDGGAAGAGTKDHVKQADEFHTVAIFGERSGGTQYTALDVTTPDDYTKVKMLWSFPQPLTTDAFYMGQSWADFAPRPPPIGPVRIADATDSRGWAEKWIVMISGGYDPAMTRGRAVFMVDVWSGGTLWRYTDDTFKTQLGFAGSGTSMFPVTAAVALLDIGEPSSQTFDADGFFDTATWGDLGGNLFVARFWTPGTPSASAPNLIDNWYAARTFEQRRQSDNSQVATGRSEFHFMTSNAFEPNTRSLRTFLGSGNRERLMQQGAACGPDNLLACCQSGCAVTSTTKDEYGECSVTNTFACTSGGVMTQTPTTPSSSTCGSAAVCAAPEKTVSLDLNCGSGKTSSATGTITCDANGLCTTGTSPFLPYTAVGAGHDVAPPGEPSRNRFYGIWSYGGIATKTFTDQASARTFDANRFTDVDFTGSCTGTRGNSCKLVDTTSATASFVGDPKMVTVACPSGTPCTAQSTDPGWYYEYGRACPASGCVNTTWNDEKTGSGSSVVLGCAAWSGLRPIGVASGGDPCSNLATPITYGYLSDYVTGAPSATCSYADATTLYRATQRSTTAPPSAPLVRVTVNAAGKVSYSTLQLDSGAPPANKQIGTRNDLFEPVYWLEVPRDLHNCRHTATGACE